MQARPTSVHAHRASSGSGAVQASVRRFAPSSIARFDNDAGLLQYRCKTSPSYHERLAWGQGDGSGLRAVDSAVGRIGSLACSEHYNRRTLDRPKTSTLRSDDTEANWSDVASVDPTEARKATV
jgi:hypothetical protein